MRRPLLGLSLILSVLVLLVAVPALATSPHELLEVKIPFEFVVNETTLPAGQYLIQPADEDEPGAMEISNSKTDQSVFFLTQPIPDTRSHDQAKVVFLEANGKHHLSEVWIPAHSQGHQLLETMLGDYPETTVTAYASDVSKSSDR